MTALALAAALGAAELPFAAFMADDLMHLVVLERIAPATWVGPLDVYRVADGVPEHVRAMQDAGALPWFFDADFKMAFLRPLSSAMLALDHALWGLRPLGYRVHGALWFVALVAGVGLVFRRTLSPSSGALALVVFTISGIHGMLAWNATRHVVIAGALGMLGLAAHVRWRQTGWRAGGVLAVGGFALALAAGEAALGVLAYLLAYEALAAPGDARARLRASAPAILLLAGYLVAYRLGGYGASGSADYVDPLASPVEFLIELPGRWLFMFGALLAGVNADVWTLRPELRMAMIAGGAAVVVAFAMALRAAWSASPSVERRGGWLVVGAAAAAVPFAGTPIGARCLVLPMIGASVAIAVVLQRWWVGRHSGAPASRAVVVAAIVLVVVHLVGAPIGRLAAPYALRTMLADRLATVVRETDVQGERLPHERVVVLRAPDFMMGLYPFFFRTLYRQPMPRWWRTLSWARATHRFTRATDDTLDLDLAGGAIAAPALTTGRVVALDGLRATVLAHDRRGPTRVRFQLDGSLDDPDVVLLAWDAGRFRRVAPPPVGGTLVVGAGGIEADVSPGLTVAPSR